MSHRPYKRMSIMRYFLFCLSLVCTDALSASETPMLFGRIVDATTGEPLPDVIVFASPGSATSTSDSAGFFSIGSLPANGPLKNAHALHFSLIGHQSHTVHIIAESVDTLLIRLRRKVIEMKDEVVVFSERTSSNHHRVVNKSISTDEALHAVAGVEMVRRANFALEPSLRGAQPKQTSITIDGMKIFTACVDRMDPVTSYIEKENLQRLEISKGAFDLSKSQAVGGTVNLITKKPSFGRPLSVYVELGYESSSKHRFSRNVLNYTRANLALRTSFSYRRADDFSPGGHGAVANTQYAKYNFKIDAAKKGKTHRFDFGLLGDTAWDIGYPSLLMDARKARSYLYSAEHTWTPARGAIQQAKTRLYFSRVDHWMDDDDRDVGQREVMRDMHMPMFGKTRTWGLLENLLFARPEQTLELVLDFYYLRSFADMRMLSVFPDVLPMYLLNLGDVSRHHFAGAADYNRVLSAKLRWKSGLRLDLASQAIHDRMGQRQLAAAWDTRQLDNRYLSPSFSTALEYTIRPHTRFKLSLAHSSRLPTQLETYGFFLFNPADGYFYTGNPQLKSERSRQIELGVAYDKQHRQINVSLYYNQMDDYITGIIQEAIFKNYANIARAYIYGAELSAALPLSTRLRLDFISSYNYGHNNDFNEPLPFIAPLENRVELNYGANRYDLQLAARFVSEQKRVANRTTLEDITPFFATYGAHLHRRFSKNINLRLSIENLTDHFYHEHLSVENFPNPGRNIRLALNSSF